MVVEGEAREVADSALIKSFGVAMDTKYDTTYGGEFYLPNVTFAIRPARVIGIDGDDFIGSATRWIFGDA